MLTTESLMLPTEMKTVDAIFSTMNIRKWYFGGCIRDAFRGVLPQDLDIFIYVPVPTQPNINQCLGQILSHKKTKSFSLVEKPEHVSCYSDGERLGFSRYHIVLNEVNVDLVFSNTSIANNWGRRPDADVNLLYSSDLSATSVHVMENTCGATLPSILKNIYSSTCVFEQGASEARRQKLLNRAFDPK